MLTLHRQTDPADFLARAEAFLRASEAENVLMLGICSPDGSGHRFDDSCYLATVEDGRAVVACALRTPPFSAVISRADEDALSLLVADLAGKYPRLPSVMGPEPTATQLAGLWSARTGAKARLGTHMRVLEARRVLPPPQPSGTFRSATEEDLPIVARRGDAFDEETGLDDPTDPVDVARRRVRERSLFIWEDPTPVSMAGWAGRTGRTVRVNAVYTPPEHRRHGYASACVASLTQRLLDEGFASCCLYTDLANPTFNKIYQAIGYRPVCDVTEYDFETG